MAVDEMERAASRKSISCSDGRNVRTSAKATWILGMTPGSNQTCIDELICGDELVFDRKAGVAQLMMHNLSDAVLGFIITPTSVGCIDIQPVEGAVPPGKSVCTYCTLLPNCALPERIVVRSRTVQKNASPQSVRAVLESMRDHDYQETCSYRIRSIVCVHAMSDEPYVPIASSDALAVVDSELQSRLEATESFALRLSSRLQQANHRLASLTTQAQYTCGARPSVDVTSTDVPATARHVQMVQPRVLCTSTGVPLHALNTPEAVMPAVGTSPAEAIVKLQRYEQRLWPVYLLLVTLSLCVVRLCAEHVVDVVTSSLSYYAPC